MNKINIFPSNDAVKEEKASRVTFYQKVKAFIKRLSDAHADYEAFKQKHGIYYDNQF